MNSKEHWLVTMWRPCTAWTYCIINLFDFAIAPITYNVLQYMNPGQNLDAWTSVTLQGGGLFHLSMGAIIGVSAHGRTQEKINGTNYEPEPTPVFQQVSANKFGNVVPQEPDPVL
jgi:hypothetical protein